MLRINVTFETITEESARDGDTADHGWVDPRTEGRRSLCRGGKRIYERHVRMAQRGRFNWDLSAALRFIEAQRCESYEGQVDDRIWVRAMGEYHASQYEGLQTNYALHIEGCSDGSMRRIERLLERAGVRFA